MTAPTPKSDRLAADVALAARTETLGKVREIIESVRISTAKQAHMSGFVMREVDAALNNVLNALFSLDPP